MAKLHIKAAAATNVGRVRANNEDNYYLCGQIRRDVSAASASTQCTAPARAFLAAVCDGMGGEENGELASLLAVQALHPCPFAQIKDTALADIQAANTAICSEMENNGGARMGSTIAALYIDDNRAVCCNIGDSRVYLWKNGALRQLSTDHNKAARMVALGVLTPAQAARHPTRHELTQHLGIYPHEMLLEPAFTAPLEIAPGDVFLLCSDGLTDMVTDAQIAACLAADAAPLELAGELIRLALAGGGRDNVTVIALKVQQAPTLWQRLLGSK